MAETKPGPMVRVFRDRSGVSALAAIRLVSLPAERVEGDSRHRDEIAALERRARECEDLVRAMAGAGPSTAFALRHVVRPASATGRQGTVETWLLARTTAGDEAAAACEARRVAGQLRRLLFAVFPDHGFRPAVTVAEVSAACQPFGNVRPEFVSFLGRETRRVRFAPCQSRAGLVGVESGGQESSGEGIAFAGLVSRPSSFVRVFRALLARPGGTFLQVSFRSAQLPSVLEEELVAKIASLQDLERSAGRGTGSGGRTGSGLRLAELRLVRRSLEERLERLRREALVFDVALASTSVIDPELLRLMALELTGTQGQPSAPSSEAPWVAPLVPVAESKPRAADGGAWDRLDLALEGAATEYRATPESGLERLADSAEVVAAGFRFPVSLATEDGTLPVRVDRVRPVPPGMAALLPAGESGCAVGVNRFLGEAREIPFPEMERRQHLYCVGQTGTGKSTLLRSLILRDMEEGRGVAVLDPHGDLYEDLIARVPEHRWDDVVLLDPCDMEFPVGLNPLECGSTESMHHVAREIRAVMTTLLGDQYGGSVGQFAGPLFFLHLEMNLLLAMSRPDDPGTLLEFYEIFQDRDYWKRWLPLGVEDAVLRRWVSVNMKDVGYQKRGSDNLSLGEYISSKFEDFVFDPRLRLIFGQKRSTVRIAEILGEGKILLVNLSRGRLSETSSRFLGMLLITLFQSAAAARGSESRSRRNQFYLYADEFQSISTSSFAVLLSEARKFGLGLVLANQFVSQIRDEKIMGAVFGNVATVVSFRVSDADARQHLEPLFRPYFDARDLTNLPNWNACIRTTAGGRVLPPFSLETVPDSSVPAERVAAEVRRRSRARYGRPRAEVEAEIARSLTGTSTEVTGMSESRR